VCVLERLPLARLLAQQIARGAHELLFSSRALRARFLALLSPVARADAGARCHVCAMGIEPSAPPAPREQLRAEFGLTRLSLLSMGRLIALKGLDCAIDALASQPEVELIVAGDGPTRAELEQRARRAGARVRFVGEIRGATKGAWLSAVDAFVLPSRVLPSGRSEGVPGALLEAMDHGLPVIASDVGGVSDVVEHEHNGLLVPPEDVAALAAAIGRLADAELRAALGRDARNTAALYHWSELGPRIESLLSDN
jgi:glycosyltransferase involved in cell wall biosynthesis